MDFSKVARFFTLDVLSTIGFMAANADLWDYDKISSQFHPVFQMIVHHESLRRVLRLPGIQQLAVPKYTDKKGIGPALAFAHKAVAARFVCY